MKRQYSVELEVNGKKEMFQVSAEVTLLKALRDLGCFEVKEGCGKGDCGACAVLLNGKPVNACLTLVLQANGGTVTTLKGLGSPEIPHVLQESFVNSGAVQCGFCTAGMIIAAKGLLDANPKPSRTEIRQAISGNLCRCTGYQKIIDAIEKAAQKGAKTGLKNGGGTTNGPEVKF